MRLVSYGEPEAWRSGIEVDDQVADTAAVARLAGWSSTPASNRRLLREPLEKILQLDRAARTNIRSLKARGEAQGLAGLRLGPPVPDPEKIVCIGLNYHDHAKEVGAAPPPAPIFFAKYANSLVGPVDDIVPPRDTATVDYEAELAVVIGKRGRYIEQERALEHVAGAMAFNDVSARDLQLANQLWMGGKAVDTFGPCGPALVLAPALGDLQALKVRTRVGGELLQDGTTASMIFSIAEIVAFLSRIMTLEPGDIIATGTPAGVASAHTPPRFLKTGDVVEVEIERIGSIRNVVRDAA